MPWRKFECHISARVHYFVKENRFAKRILVTRKEQWAIQASGVLAWLDDFLYLPEVLYTLTLVWLIFSGPGRYSVDGLIAWRAGVFGVER